VTALVLAAILTLAPALQRETAERYAADIALAADGDIDLAYALVATQHVESSWRLSVETCAVTGDGGRAVSAFQMHRHWWAGYSRAEVCGSNALATSLAASALVALEHRTGGMAGALRAFVGCKPGDPRSVRRIKAYRQIGGAS
jgi:hypothetical protein